MLTDLLRAWPIESGLKCDAMVHANRSSHCFGSSRTPTQSFKVFRQEYLTQVPVRPWALHSTCASWHQLGSDQALVGFLEAPLPRKRRCGLPEIVQPYHQRKPTKCERFIEIKAFAKEHVQR